MRGLSRRNELALGVPASGAPSEQGDGVDCGKPECERPRFKVQMRRCGARVAGVAHVANRLALAHELTHREAFTDAIEMRVVGHHTASSEGVNHCATKAKFTDVNDDAVMGGEHRCAAPCEDVDALMRASSASRCTKSAGDRSARDAPYGHAQGIRIERVHRQQKKPCREGQEHEESESSSREHRLVVTTR